MQQPLKQLLSDEGRPRVWAGLFGTVALNFDSHLPDEVRRAARNQVAAIEPLRPDDIADAVPYIVSRDRRVAVNENLVRGAEQNW